MPSQCISKLLINSWFFSQGLHCLFCLSFCMQVLRISERSHEGNSARFFWPWAFLSPSHDHFFLPKMHWHFSSTDSSNYLTFFPSPLFKWTLWRPSRTWLEARLPCWINNLCRYRCWQDPPCIQESGNRQAEPRQEEWLGGCPFSHSQWAARQQSALPASAFSSVDVL